MPHKLIVEMSYEDHQIINLSIIASKNSKLEKNRVNNFSLNNDITLNETKLLKKVMLRKSPDFEINLKPLKTTSVYNW